MTEVKPPDHNVKWSLLRLRDHAQEGMDDSAVAWLAQFGPWQCSECGAERPMHQIAARSGDGCWMKCRDVICDGPWLENADI